jgi:hypothetical protein
MTGTTTITYVLADIADDGRIALAAVSDDPAARDILHALAFVRDATGRWSGCQLSNRLVGIHLALPGEPFGAVAVGIDGGVCEISGSKQTWTLMEAGGEGPNTLVPLITSRRLGDVIVAAGMQRRVYAGNPSGWRRIDEGLRIQADDLAVSGILSLDGDSPERLWTAGYAGEIWRREEGKWHRIDSPTNAKLIALRQLPDTSVMVAGANGVSFIGNGSAWHPVAGLESYAAIAIETFDGLTYVAVRGGGLYVLQPDGLERVQACYHFPVYAISACSTALLAVGPLGLRVLDNTGWRDVAPPIPLPIP